ncbi:unnamed protein product, partial [Plutella xylostella]
PVLYRDFVKSSELLISVWQQKSFKALLCGIVTIEVRCEWCFLIGFFEVTSESG